MVATIRQQIDLDNYTGKPVFEKFSRLLETVIDPTRFDLNFINLRPNYIDSKNGYFANIFNQMNYTFFEVLPIIKNNKVRNRKE